MSRMRHLSLNIESVDITTVLSSVLPRCPNLESLDLDIKLPDESVDSVAALIRVNCPGLKRLRLCTLAFRTFIQACTVGLEHLKIDHRGFISTPLISVLAPTHSETLTSLVLTQTHGPDPETVMDIFCSCPNLITFFSSVHQESRPSDARESHEESLIRRMERPWICLNIRTLALIYTAGRDNSAPSSMLKVDVSFQDVSAAGVPVDAGGTHTLMDRYLKYMMTQIGEMSRLKELAFMPRSPDHVLQAGGYLDKFSKLRNLQGVNLRIAPKEAEARWIMEHWPMLTEIHGIGTTKGDVFTQLLTTWKSDFVIRERMRR
ncbi:hypothetical protein BG004_000983 [Podila humilis]|nr:hypothetical protein BG004_000983 [Podila humilis]